MGQVCYIREKQTSNDLRALWLACRLDKAVPYRAPRGIADADRERRLLKP